MDRYNDDVIVRFAKNVKFYRTRAGISQEELAFNADVHRTYIGMVERCERNVSLIYAEKIAKALNINLEDLVK